MIYVIQTYTEIGSVAEEIRKPGKKHEGRLHDPKVKTI